MRFYGDILRVDEEQRMVWGYASTTGPADDGMTITKGALEDALDDYMQFANIREMHQLSAVGVAREASVDDGGMYVGAHVVDDAAWKKVTSKVYKAFSIKGNITGRDPLNRSVVTGIKLKEISLVDRPGDPGTVFDVWRAATEEPSMPKKEPASIDVAAVVDPTVAAAAAEVTPAAEITARAAGVEPAPDAGAAAVANVAAVATVDPVAKATEGAEAAIRAATDAVARAEQKAGGSRFVNLPGAALRRGMWSVSALGAMLCDLAYMVTDAQFEATLEGDASPVPAKLREALAALAAAYKSMSDEELAELLKGVNVDDLIDAAAVSLAAAGGDLERASGITFTEPQSTHLQQAFDAAIARGWKPKALAPTDLAKVEAERDTLVRTVNGLADQVTALTARVEKLAAMPMPPKTAATTLARSVSKEQDAAGETTAAQPSDDEVQRLLAGMSEEDRATLLVRAALSRPIAITR